MSRTDVRAFFESKYLGAWDVAEKGDVILVIDRCEGQVIKGQGGKEDKCPVLYFRNITNRAKGMVLNKTNTKALIRLYGAYIEDWPGKRIFVYATKTTVGGEEVDCLRIRPKEPPAKASNPELPTSPSEREPGDEQGSFAP
jgi:hypothetical protein